MSDGYTWPVFDCLGRKIPHRNTQVSCIGMICQGRAYRDGRWLPWNTISATVYENRRQWPRAGYQVRITKDTQS